MGMAGGKQLSLVGHIWGWLVAKQFKQSTLIARLLPWPYIQEISYTCRVDSALP